MPAPSQAFLLGAGLGTRLRPITNVLPKPLIPIAHQPLIAHAMRHLNNTGVADFIINTHHLAHHYAEAFPNYPGHHHPIQFRHEPTLLETAGGLANVADLLTADQFWVYNGDILANFDLNPVWHAHKNSTAEVTLALRSSGPSPHIAWDAPTGRITDIRSQAAGNAGTHQFTGVYLVSQPFLTRLTPGKKESVIPHFLDLIRSGSGIQGVVVDDGFWLDVGDLTSYLAVHRALAEKSLTLPIAQTPIHSAATVSPDATLDEWNFIGPHSVVEAGAHLQHCVVWGNAKILAGAHLQHCVVTASSQVTPGYHKNHIFTA